MGKLFGTDGVRGLVNSELDCGLAFRLGQAAVDRLGSTVLIGRDTRRSGEMLGCALAAGVMSRGGTVLDAGVVPTPAVALLVRELGVSAGVVISASHNPPEYNGIKFFDAAGFKLSDESEAALEELVLSGACDEVLATGTEVGELIGVEDAAAVYVEHAVEAVREGGGDLAGMKLVVDCAHGASSVSTPEALRLLGAEVVAFNDDWDGTDINVDCGSTHLEPLRKAVLEHGADFGIAHDGDADRVLFVSPTGREIDGDKVLAICARDLHERGELSGEAVVATVMSNEGFVQALASQGVEVVRAGVGDRYVLAEMLSRGHVLGGEQSGHTIFLDHNTTGDGLMTACLFLAACKRLGLDGEAAADAFEAWPQTLINVRGVDKARLREDAAVAEALAKGEGELEGRGRILLRPSGTEPVVRVMVEADDAELAQAVAESIAKAVEDNLSS